MGWQPQLRYEIGVEFAAFQPTPWSILEQARCRTHSASWGLMKERRRESYGAHLERQWRAKLDALVADGWSNVAVAHKINMLRARKRNQERREREAAETARWRKVFGGDSDRCHGVTGRSRRCRRHTVSATRFCALHLPGR